MKVKKKKIYLECTMHVLCLALFPAFRLNNISVPECVIVVGALLHILHLAICSRQPDSLRSSVLPSFLPTCLVWPFCHDVTRPLLLGFRCHHGSHLAVDYF